MKIYSTYGHTDFVICCGYRGEIIKQYFANYFLNNADVTFDLRKNDMQIHRQHAEPWRVTLVNTGDKSMTGGRVKRIQSHVGDETFCLTYGDGVSDVNISDLIEFHRQQKDFRDVNGRPIARTLRGLPAGQGANDSSELRGEADRRWRLD